MLEEEEEEKEATDRAGISKGGRKLLFRNKSDRRKTTEIYVVLTNKKQINKTKQICETRKEKIGKLEG